MVCDINSYLISSRGFGGGGGGYEGARRLQPWKHVRFDVLWFRPKSHGFCRESWSMFWQQTETKIKEIDWIEFLSLVDGSRQPFGFPLLDGVKYHILSQYFPLTSFPQILHLTTLMRLQSFSWKMHRTLIGDDIFRHRINVFNETMCCGCMTLPHR